MSKYFCYFIIISPWKGCGASFEQTWILTQGCFVPRLVKIGPVVLGKKILNFTNIFLLFHNKYDNNDDNNTRENRILNLKQKKLKRKLQNLFNFFFKCTVLVMYMYQSKGNYKFKSISRTAFIYQPDKQNQSTKNNYVLVTYRTYRTPVLGYKLNYLRPLLIPDIVILSLNQRPLGLLWGIRVIRW